MLPTEYPDEDTVSCDEFYDKMEDEDFVNCICQIQEENGLMIQVSLEYSLCARPFNVHSFLWGGATSSQINYLGSIQVEPPALRSTAWGTYRWSHLLPDQLGSIQVTWQLHPHSCFSRSAWGNTHCFPICLIIHSVPQLQSDISTVVAHVLKVHICCVMYTNHIHVIVHT